MLKWSEYSQDGVLFEAYLPGHELEDQQWLIRASRDGVLLAERRIELTWVPRFGPDAGDVAQIEAALDAMLKALSSGRLDASPDGRRVSYEPVHPHLKENNPVNAALAHGALEDYGNAAKVLDLDESMCRAFGGLPAGLPIAGTLPMMVTNAMRERMVAVGNVFDQLRSLKDPFRRRHFISQLAAEMSAGRLDGVRALSDELTREHTTGGEESNEEPR
ncbi:hypothetical protein [Dokdonella sp.]|uniref:hypothetical protein n=1 Tax=Dokdonella sp. TaxID=2291710 RepID=UPI002F4168A1